MLFRASLSIKQKTIIGIASIEAILLVLLIGTAIKFMLDFNNEAMQKRAITAVSLFATSTQDASLSYDLASLQAYAEQMLKNPDVVYARVINEEGEVFANAALDSYQKIPFEADSSIFDTQDGIYDATASIVAADIVYGHVEIGIATSAIQQTMNRFIRNLSMIALLEMTLVAMFSFALGSYLTKQLRRLRSGANKVSEAISHGEFGSAKIVVDGKDELTEVADAFNSLVDKLRAEFKQRKIYQNNLEELNTSLERKVHKRTAALKNQNTALKEINEQLKLTQKQLLHAEKMASVGQLAAGVAHEINNPVGYVLSNMQTLEEYVTSYQNALKDASTLIDLDSDSKNRLDKIMDDYDLAFVGEDSADLLTQCQKGLKKVKEIISGLKNFAYAGDDSFTKIDLNKCITETLNMVRNELKYHCEIQTQLAKSAEINGNEGKISQVLTNLLINAGQAIEENGKISIRTKQNCDVITLEVADNGCGIPDENLKKLFDPFFTTKPIGEGTGLGLAISYGIVRDHEGKISVESTPDKGTCFSLTFPRADKNPMKEAI